MLIYKKTDWCYEIKRARDQIGAGVGFDVPYGMRLEAMSPRERRTWTRRGMYRDERG